MSKPIIVAPSILSADFANMGRDIQSIARAGGAWVHLDVMDGNFVPPLTFGAQMVQALRPHSSLPFDVHLMVARPQDHVDDFARAGADHLTFHLEACIHAHRLLQHIKSLGLKAGIAIVPATPVSALAELFTELDLILVMSVNPGYGGQKIIPRTLAKIAELDRLKKQHNFSYQISVDGGVNLETIATVRASGVEIIVVGSAFFAHPDIAARSKFIGELKQKK